VAGLNALQERFAAELAASWAQYREVYRQMGALQEVRVGLGAHRAVAATQRPWRWQHHAHEPLSHCAPLLSSTARPQDLRRADAKKTASHKRKLAALQQEMAGQLAEAEARMQRSKRGRGQHGALPAGIANMLQAALAAGDV
jgi:hypothetical protein